MLAVVYLVFNEGYAASSGTELVRAELCAEAVRLGRLLAELMPDEPEVLGLLALMLLSESRRAARTDEPAATSCRSPSRIGASGTATSIAEGQAIVRALPAAQRAGPVPDPGGDRRRPQRRAARRRPPTGGRSSSSTTSCSRYDPSPVVALNRAVAVAEVDGPEAGARPRGARWTSARYYLFHAIRADLLRRLGRDAEAARAYEAAIERTDNAAEREFLSRRRASLPGRR